MNNYTQKEVSLSKITLITKLTKESLTNQNYSNNQTYYEIIHKEIIPEFCHICMYPIIAHLMP